MNTTTDTEKTQVFFEISVDTVLIGRIVFELYPDTPITNSYFSTLSRSPVKKGDITYKGTIFNRIFQGFMIQGGDLNHHNRQNKKRKSINYLNYEGDPIAITKTHEKSYLISMINHPTHPDYGQFIITTAPCPMLDGYCGVFGEVIEGFDLLRIIESYGSPSGKPYTTFVVSKTGIL